MNRKLINGLLLLTVTTGGVGMFTSCKDNEDVTKTEILGTQSDLYKKLKEMIDGKEDKLTDAQRAELQRLLNKIDNLDVNNLLTTADKTALEGQIQALANQIAGITIPTVDLSNIENTLGGIEKYLNGLTSQLITSVEIQRCYNPMFGTFNLPIGMNSTVLADYFYRADHDITFPNNGNSSYEYITSNIAGDLGDRWDALGVKNETYAANKSLIGSLGNLYITINPTNVDCSGLPIRLVKSNGEYVLGELELASENDIVFDFGYTPGVRAGKQNGLYKVNVKASAADIEKIKLEIESGLKTAAKKLFQDRNKSGIADLAYAIYEQFNGILPAYAVEITKTVPSFNLDENEVASVSTIPLTLVSKYDIAATTFHPLSFRSGLDIWDGHKIPQLPTFGSLRDSFNKFFDELTSGIHIDLGISGGYADIKHIENLDINGNDITIDLGVIDMYDNAGNVIGKSDPIKIVLTKGKEGKIENVTYADLTPLYDAFGQSATDKINDVIDQMNDMIAQINADMSSIQGNLDSQISDILADMKDKIGNKLESAQRFVNLYNRVANKLNSMIENPNAYLQVYAAYQDGNGDLHHLSTDPNDPSVFAKGGKKGDAVELFLTSYNANLVVPAFKKYVAVVGEVGNANADLKKLNAGGAGLNEVIDGTTIRAGINAANLQAGKTYEILYSALDYRGYTSTRRYYITVK